MASIHFISDEQPKEPEVWNLRLTRTEAEVLRVILGKVTGSYDGPRSISSGIYWALVEAGIDAADILISLTENTLRLEAK